MTESRDPDNTEDAAAAGAGAKEAGDDAAKATAVLTGFLFVLAALLAAGAYGNFAMAGSPATERAEINAETRPW